MILHIFFCRFRGYTCYLEIFEALNRKHYRYTMLWHLLWIYLIERRNPSDAPEALRLVWESIPDAFLSYGEIATAFEALGPQRVERIYKLYSESVSEFDSSVHLRSLQHFSRTAIRKRLWKNKHWLPDGIRKTGLPQKLQSYLNLEKKDTGNRVTPAMPTVSGSIEK
ncbi:hypothetical protein AVEN_16600-1 [Araneus ventricosus]|uniref:SOCS box domain-containing protein n=1 Tax=Araneus ventricosus TaxID=182803 RepID=A0A4Y2VH90_ARAVE|nr:hypothetical protein AVEN_16600-1 [Araneus ventricosus]